MATRGFTTGCQAITRYPPQALIDGDVPARLGHAPFEGEHVAGAEQVGILRHLRLGVVQRGAEDGVAAQRGGRVGPDDVDPLGPCREVVDEEPEESERARRSDAFRQQQRALVRREGEVLRQGEAVVDVDVEVVGGQRERAAVDHKPGRGVGRGFGVERPAAPQLPAR